MMAGSPWTPVEVGGRRGESGDGWWAVDARRVHRAGRGVGTPRVHVQAEELEQPPFHVGGRRGEYGNGWIAVDAWRVHRAGRGVRTTPFSRPVKLPDGSLVMDGLPWTPGEFVEQAEEAEHPRFTSCEAAGQVAECRVRGLHAGPEAVEAARMQELRRREKRAASSMTRRARCPPRPRAASRRVGVSRAIGTRR
jgi:hypothetical protein